MTTHLPSRTQTRSTAINHTVPHQLSQALPPSEIEIFEAGSAEISFAKRLQPFWLRTPSPTQTPWSRLPKPS